jgi:predicted nucleic acid-binding protein
MVPARYNLLDLPQVVEAMPSLIVDFLITATAVVLDVPLVTRDEAITSAGVVEVLW